MSQQTTSRVIMVRPAAFGYNVETAANNTFQHVPQSGQDEVKAQAILEFDRLVATLRDAGVDGLLVEDTNTPVKPDAVFPNNWFSLHEDGTVVTYPMYSALRRQERREDLVDQLSREFIIHQRLSLEIREIHEQFLEGTGSMVLDRANKIAYACISPRTDAEVLKQWCDMMGYQPFTFHATYHGQEIYHTNVMMAIGDGVAVICLEVIEPGLRQKTREHLMSFGREVVELRLDQIDAFAGNMLAVRSKTGEQLMVMSRTAHESLDKNQKASIERHARILSSDVHTIETIGGGSVRCMIAENFLQKL